MRKNRAFAHFLANEVLFSERFPYFSVALEQSLILNEVVILKLVVLASTYPVLGGELSRLSPASFRGIRCGI